MVLGIGVRTVWVAIRGANYTDRAFRQVGRNIDKLIKEQQMLREQAVQMMTAGVMWGLMAAMMVGGMIKIIGASEKGAWYMNRLQRSISRLGESFSRVMIKIIGPILERVIQLLDWLAANEWAVTLLVGIMMVATAFLAWKAITMMVTGAMTLLGLSMSSVGVSANQLTIATEGTGISLIDLEASSNLATMGLTNLEAGFDAATVSATGLQVVVSRLLFFFIIGYTAANMLVQMFGDWRAALLTLIPIIIAMATALWMGASAMSVLTWGGAAAAGAVAMAALAATQPAIPTYQMGTRMMARTAPVLAHRGEVIYNPQRGLPTTIERESAKPRKSEQNVDIHIENLHVKSDFDEFDKKMRRELRDLIREST